MALLGMDLIGILPTSQGKLKGMKYILTMYDAFSHFLVAVPIPNKEAETVMEAFVDHILLQGRLPGAICFDNGSEFKGVFRKFLKAVDVKYGCTIPYHPQSNFTERVHRFINEVIRAVVSEPSKNVHQWADILPYVVFAYNRKSIPGTAISPYMLRTGKHPRLPDDWQRPQGGHLERGLQETLEDKGVRLRVYKDLVANAHARAKEKYKLKYDARQLDREFEVDDTVLWYHPTRDGKYYCHWQGPYKVVKKLSRVRYLLELMADARVQKDASVQHMILFRGKTPFQDLGDEKEAPTTDLKKARWERMKRGKFVAYRQVTDPPDWVKFAEVLDDIEPGERVHFHHWIDAYHGANFRKDVAKRTLKPEFEDLKTGQSFTSDRYKKGEYAPVETKYHEDDLVIYCPSFDMHSKGKVPEKIVYKIYEELDKG